MLRNLSKIVKEDDYFIELYLKLETASFFKFFNAKATTKILTDKEFQDILRFAEILSFSDNADERNYSYKVISLLYDFYNQDSLYLKIAESILVRLGNFPALNFIVVKEKEITNDKEVELERIVKEIYQKDPYSNNIFTDAQFAIYKSLINNNHFSFSGPTSLGKSFIMEAFIKYLIKEHNYNENMVVLVPTRALINQISKKLKIELSTLDDKKNILHNYKVLTHPVIPQLITDSKTKYIFVFTPERLISYFSNINNPKIDYMFIDEAHKIVANNDSRSPLFYHSILQAEKKSVKLFFASPNVPNVDIFLELFEKSTKEITSIKESPVAQNRYFLDLISHEARLFSDVSKEKKYRIREVVGDYNRKFNFWLKKLGSDNKNIIYCNSTKDTVNFAVSFSKTLEKKEDDRIDKLIKLIKEHVHKEYYLIDCLKKGVGYHFGRLPQRIRESLEALFSEKVIDYLFCTSTLLEGVNMPAKNVFILSNKIGLSNFKDIDFWNLAGRAGRLTKELSGNIICVRLGDKSTRWNNEKSLDVVRDRYVSPIQPDVIYGKGNFYKNIKNSLENKPFTNQSASADKMSSWKHYGNIAFVHALKHSESLLKNTLISKENASKKILDEKINNNRVPVEILSTSSMIKADYQNKIYKVKDLSKCILEGQIDKDTCYKALSLLYEMYSWNSEEVFGHNPLVKKDSKTKLMYYAILMRDWIGSKPLNLIINNAINYYKGKGIYIENHHIEHKYDGKNRYVTNLIINDVMRDIETNLRFKLKNYFNNYYMLIKHKLGESNAGVNWGDFLEYGTNDYRIIELQNIGLPRYIASYLLDNFLEFIEFRNNNLLNIDCKMILESIQDGKREYMEFKEWCLTNMFI